MWVISWQAEDILASQESPCFMQLVNLLQETLQKLEDATWNLAFINTLKPTVKYV